MGCCTSQNRLTFVPSAEQDNSRLPPELQFGAILAEAVPQNNPDFENQKIPGFRVSDVRDDGPDPPRRMILWRKTPGGSFAGAGVTASSDRSLQFPRLKPIEFVRRIVGRRYSTA